MRSKVFITVRAFKFRRTDVMTLFRLSFGVFFFHNVYFTRNRIVTLSQQTLHRVIGPAVTTVIP